MSLPCCGYQSGRLVRPTLAQFHAQKPVWYVDRGAGADPSHTHVGPLLMRHRHEVSGACKHFDISFGTRNSPNTRRFSEQIKVKIGALQVLVAERWLEKLVGSAMLADPRDEQV